MRNIWFISKYGCPDYSASVGARGFLLLKQFVKKGKYALQIVSDSNHTSKPPEFEGRYYSEQVSGVEVVWIKTMKYVNPKSLRRILSWLDFEWKLFFLKKSNYPRPDIIIISSLSLLTIVNGILLSSRYKAKLVFEVRDLWPDVLIFAGGYHRLHPAVIFLRFFERLAYRSADLIVGTMPNLKSHVSDIVPCAENKVICIPQGYDPNVDRFSKEVGVCYLKKYIPEDKFIICHAGSIGADNALETFFEAAQMMRENEKVCFVVLGDGYLKSKYQSEYGHLSNVIFAPRVNRSQVKSVLKRVGVLYFAVHDTPLMQCGQSLNKVVDYMAAGRPILASFSGYQSMINEAECGTFVPAGDVSALVDEIVRYSEMTKDELDMTGQRGREWLLENRTFERLADVYLDYLE